MPLFNDSLHVPSDQEPANRSRSRTSSSLPSFQFTKHEEKSSPSRERNRSSRRGYHDDHTVEDNWRVHDLEAHYGPKRRKWHKRPSSPSLRWFKKYTPASLLKGRVLVIDYIKEEFSTRDQRKVVAQEIHSLEHMRRFYEEPKFRQEAYLRVIHVQNADWAIEYLSKKFNIEGGDDIVSNEELSRYIRYKNVRQRAGKPLLSGKTWKVQHDPWRSITKTAFGLDYFKCYKARNKSIYDDWWGKMFELNCYDEEDRPRYAYDVYAQRMSVYVQRQEERLGNYTPDGDPDIRNPYSEESRARREREEYFPELGSLDNGSTIIIFDHSCSQSITDTIISARHEWESRWRRLPFYLSFDVQGPVPDEQMTLLCMQSILHDIFKAVSQQWERFLDKANHHVGILEEKIYENPADESRANELWLNSNMWLKVERLIYIHVDMVREMQTNLTELSDDNSFTWIDASTGDFDRIRNLVQEDLVKPTTGLADLMYKSVGIRDSRHSLQLSMSMWRLSWITFIFLPLTFTVGFFGMNVDTFQDNPSIKYYFITSVPLMVVTFVSWYFIKHFFERARQSPFSRGIYERLFHELAILYPRLWTRQGPRDHVTPRTRLDRIKWDLIRMWSDPEKTIAAGDPDMDDPFDGLGQISRFQRKLTRQWTEDVNKSTMKAGLLVPGGHALEEGIAQVNQFFSVPGTPQSDSAVRARRRTEHNVGIPHPDPTETTPPTENGPGLGGKLVTGAGTRTRDPSRPAPDPQTGNPRPRSAGSGGFMVEEETPGWMKGESDRSGSATL